MKTASMTQQQKREKAAELLGWVKNKHPMSGEELWYNTTLRPKYEGFSGWLNPPSYDEDLNLMAEAEAAMTDEQYMLFGGCLVGRADSLKTEPQACRATISATAAQRLDAWLEVMMEGEE